MFSKFKRPSLVFFLLFFSSFDLSASKTERFQSLELFNRVLYLVESQYFEEVETDKLIQGAIHGMMNVLDPHSAYLPPDVYQKMQEETEGRFGGLGVEVSQQDGILVVITPIDDTPAFRAGILAGDRIIEIDGESTVGIPMERAVDLMRGDAGTEVRIGISRDGHDGTLYKNLVREIIKIQAVRSSIIFDEFIYLRLSQFQSDVGADLASHLFKLKDEIVASGKKVRGIILDVRSNPGGLLDEAVNVASVFLDEGIVVQTQGREVGNKEIRYVRRDGQKDLETPLVVLINGASASASEIVAGALQDYERAIIMGSDSFGKGSVQSIARIDKSQGIKLTVAQYKTPKGRKIQARGIRPDITLDEVQAKWIEENRQEPRFIREVDLRNHLAPRGSEEEQRETIGPLRVTKKDEQTSTGRPRPQEDYQVVQAINYLRTYRLLERREN